MCFKQLNVSRDREGENRDGVVVNLLCYHVIPLVKKKSQAALLNHNLTHQECEESVYKRKKQTARV